MLADAVASPPDDKPDRPAVVQLERPSMSAFPTTDQQLSPMPEDRGPPSQLQLSWVRMACESW